MNTKQTQSVRQSRSGFTLIELLMAMFILSLGLAAISSLFPVSALIQRRSFDEQMARLIKDNTTALITAHKFESAGLPNSSKVAPATENKKRFQVHPTQPLQSGEWPLSMRCFPMYNDNRPFNQRDYYWVPLFRKYDGDYQVFIFILRKQAGIGYGKKDNSTGVWAVQEVSPNATEKEPLYKVPGVKKANVTMSGNKITLKDAVDQGGFIQIGDQILTSSGRIVIVKEIDGNNLIIDGTVSGDAVWYGRPPQAGMEAVTLRIFVIGQEAIK